MISSVSLIRDPVAGVMWERFAPRGFQWRGIIVQVATAGSLKKSL